MVFEIQRLSTEDGPGIRTTVFLKGCSLACAWCHNPESLSPHPELHWIAARCIGCRTCAAVCPEKALQSAADAVIIDRTRCTACGVCAAECPSTALEMIGTRWGLDDLVREVLKDRAYFANGGGVTAGGGEPGLQAPFLAAFLQALKAEGIHTAVDTCGGYPGHMLESFLPFTALVLYDLKTVDPHRHRSWTGRANTQILENLLAIRDRLVAGGPPHALWVRTPVIPEATADAAVITEIGGWIAAHLEGVVARWELCAFNNLCRDKYQRLGRNWPYKDKPLLALEAMEALARSARRSGVAPHIVHWSGSTRMPAAGDPAITGAPEGTPL